MSGTSGDNQLYGSVGHRGAESTTWSFNAPFPIGGISYREKTVYRVKEIEDALPSTPTGGTYAPATDTLTPPTGWSNSFPSTSDYDSDNAGGGLFYNHCG